MSTEHDHNHHEPEARRHGWVLFGFIAIAAFFLFSEHRAHILGILPYLLLLACPLMHLFMHHGGHGRHGRAAAERPEPPKEDRHD